MNNVGRDDNRFVQELLQGGVVAFPTETVMGLGVIFDNKEAYEKLNIIKGRPEDKPYTMMLSNIDDIKNYAYVNERDAKIIKEFMPGPLTILLKAKENVPTWVTHGTGIIGIRVPDFKIIQELLYKVKKPLLVPSANPSGKSPAKNVFEVTIYFGETLNYIYDYNALGKAPSTIVDLTDSTVKLVRKGDIPIELISKII